MRDDQGVTPVSDRAGQGFDERLTAAEARLSGQGRKGGSSQDAGSGSGQDYSALGLALRLGTELVAGLAVGVAIGFGLDKWLGYRALFLVIFSLLGGVAGMLNVWHVVSKTMVDDGTPSDGHGG